MSVKQSQNPHIPQSAGNPGKAAGQRRSSPGSAFPPPSREPLQKSAATGQRAAGERARISADGKRKAERSKLVQSLRTNQLRKINKEDQKSFKAKLEPWDRERMNGARIYHMTGYTTVEKIDRKFGFEQKQIILRKVIATLILTLAVLIVMAKLAGTINPEEFNRIAGRASGSESIQEADRDAP